MSYSRFVTAVVVMVVCLPSLASPVVISDVPAYTWYHGCEPTSIGMIMGYWDLHGYPNLFAAQGSAVYLTANVQDEISSPAHNAKYDSTPDDPNLSVPPRTSIADFLGTSIDPLEFGISAFSAKTAVTSYASYKGYTFQSSNFYFPATWNILVSEVGIGRPILFFVDSNGDRFADHVVPAFGYDDRGVDGLWYATYTTASEEEIPVWYKYQPIAQGEVFGVYGSTQVVPLDPPMPEPLTLAILLLGAPAILFRKRKVLNQLV